MQRDEWAEMWDMLQRRFDTDRGEKVGSFYLMELNERLSDAEIRAGARRVMYANTYWPSPREIVEAAGGELSEEEVEAEALEQWELVRSAMSNSRAGLPDEATAETERLVRKMGGLRALGQKDLDELPFVEKRFRRDYAAVSLSGEAGELPPMTDEGRGLVEDAMAGELTDGPS